jgi:hypothetical protein
VWKKETFWAIVQICSTGNPVLRMLDEQPVRHSAACYPIDLVDWTCSGEIASVKERPKVDWWWIGSFILECRPQHMLYGGIVIDNGLLDSAGRLVEDSPLSRVRGFVSSGMRATADCSL